MSCSRASFVSLAGPIVHTIFVRRASIGPECHKSTKVRRRKAARPPLCGSRPSATRHARERSKVVLNTHPMFGRNQQGVATLGGTPLETLLAQAGCGTPAYLYDLDGVRAAARALADSLGDGPSLIAFAAKANSAAPVLKALFVDGCGADVVSGAELALVQEVGLSPDKIVFSGVAKRDDEIDGALCAGGAGIYAIQAESVEEIARIAARATTAGRRARVSLRINPGIAIDTHAHVATGHDEAKFGIARGDLGDAFAAVDLHPSVALVGLSSHIGSTQTSTAPYESAARVLFDIARAREASRGPLEFVDAG